MRPQNNMEVFSITDTQNVIVPPNYLFRCASGVLTLQNTATLCVEFTVYMHPMKHMSNYAI